MKLWNKIWPILLTVVLTIITLKIYNYFVEPNLPKDLYAPATIDAERNIAKGVKDVRGYIQEDVHKSITENNKPAILISKDLADKIGSGKNVKIVRDKNGHYRIEWTPPEGVSEDDVERVMIQYVDEQEGKNIEGGSDAQDLNDLGRELERSLCQFTGNCEDEENNDNNN